VDGITATTILPSWKSNGYVMLHDIDELRNLYLAQEKYYDDIKALVCHRLQ
jgi:hypothetical protein